MPKFSLFHKHQKQQKKEEPAEPPQEETNVTEESKQQTPQPQQEEPKQEPAASAESEPETGEQPIEPEKEGVVHSKTYLKAMPLKELNDVERIKEEVTSGNIVILRVTPLASKSIEAVKTAVNNLYEFTESVGGDIARLGEERVVICPKNIRIWREKTPVESESGSTAA